MKVGDLVVFRGDEDRVTGLIVSEDPPQPYSSRRPRLGVWWSDHDQVEWEPEKYMEVVSESR